MNARQIISMSSATAVSLLIAACGGGGSSGTSWGSAAAGSAPTIASLPASKSIVQDTSSDPITFSVSDAQSSAAALTVAATSSNATLLTARGIELGGEGSSRTLVLTPEEGLAGITNVLITVSDPSGQSTAQTLPVTVTARAGSFKQLVEQVMPLGERDTPVSTRGVAWSDFGYEETSAFSAWVN